MHGVEVLLPGERVLWEGRPVRHRLFRSGDVLLLLLHAVALWFLLARGGGRCPATRRASSSC